MIFGVWRFVCKLVCVELCVCLIGVVCRVGGERVR